MRRIVTVILTALMAVAANAGAADRASAPEPAASVAGAQHAQKLDLNRATKEELLSIPGIGPRTAQDIVDLRSRKGYFTKIEELLEVRGIKVKKLAKLSPHLTIAPRPAAALSSPQK